MFYGMKRLLIFVAVIIIPTVIILLYPYQKNTGISSIEPKSFPGWHTTQQPPSNCSTQLKGYPFVYLYDQSCQRRFSPVLLVIDFALVSGIIFLFGMLIHYFRKPAPAGIRQLKLRLAEFKLLVNLAGIAVLFTVFGLLSGLIQPSSIIVLLLCSLAFGGTSYVLFNRWKNRDLHNKLIQTVKKSSVFFGGLVLFMIVLFLALLIAHRFNEGLAVRETFGSLALGTIFICFAVQVIATMFRDAFKHSKRPKS